MTKIKPFTLNWFKAKLDFTIRLAGPRYSPKVHVVLPINRMLHWLARTDEFYKEFDSLKESLNKEWEKSSLRSRSADVNLDAKKVLRLEGLLSQLIIFIEKSRKPSFDALDFDSQSKNAKEIGKVLADLHTDLQKILIQAEKTPAKGQEPPKDHMNPKERVNHYLHEIRKIEEIIYKVQNLFNSDFASASNSKNLLLLGEAGIGKTHLLCDTAAEQIRNKIPALIVLGQQLQTVADPLEAIIAELGSSLSKRKFLERLQRLAVNRNRRVLVLIDAINEGDRAGWRKSLKKFIAEFAPYPALAVAISCRNHFDKVTVPRRLKITKLTHTGFARHELNALKVYTSFYKIPLPEIPVLAPEFSNPLFLKLFCESLENAVVKQRHKQIQDISSGQKGMTNILEDIVIEKGRKIGKAFGIEPHFVWKIIKEDFASYFATNKKSWALLTEALSIVGKYFPDKNKGGRFLRALIVEGLLAEDIVFDPKTKKPDEVIRFTYQKFSDHIIARHLLGKHFDKKDPKMSLSQEDKLGWLFKGYDSVYSNAGLIEALMIEFPTRIANKGEMMDYLPPKIVEHLIELFVSGLYWRDLNSFNDSTDKWVSHILKDEQYQEKILDVLVALATKPKHSYNARRLHAYLMRFSMCDRDLLWSEYLRQRDDDSAIYKIIDWIERFKGVLKEEYASTYIVILQWILTTTNRPLRDRATRALYYVGKQYPEVLFGHTEISLKINDPYVPERMLAASYGVAMALHYENPNNFNRHQLLPFSKKIFSLIFSKKAPHSTTHALMRDYARHIIEISLLHIPDLLSKTQKVSIRPPYKRGGIRRWREEKDRDEKDYRNGSAPMHMDFHNYTLGRLVRDRNNYDDKHPGHQVVVGNIFWRIYQLGYSHDAFKTVDSLISNYNWNRSDHIKVDRYGKKYCWIAFYELAGHRDDEGLLREKYFERISDSDIDPSFPEELPTQPLVTHDWLGKDGRDIADWIQNGKMPDLSPYLKKRHLFKAPGPWVLLDGFVSQENLESNRNIFVFIRGFLIPRNQSTALIKSLNEYPESLDLPDVPSHIYAFAGEIPWCETYRGYKAEKQIEVPTGKKITVQVPIRKPLKVTIIKFGDKEMRFPNHSKEDLEKGYTEHEEWEKIKFDAQVPATQFGWESGRSIVNPGPHAYIPSKEICANLRLTSRPQTFNMYDQNGNIASLSLLYGDTWHNGSRMFYLKKSLLDKFLKKKKLELVWVVSGERCFRSKEHQDLEVFSKKHTSYKFYKYVTKYN